MAKKCAKWLIGLGYKLLSYAPIAYNATEFVYLYKAPPIILFLSKRNIAKASLLLISLN